MPRFTASEFRSAVDGTVIPAVPVPMDANGRVHEAAQGRYVAHMRSQPIAAVAAWAHTGRGLHLSPDQRRTVLKSWKDSGLLVITGVGAPHDATDPLEAAIGLAREATDWGADALLIHPPTKYRTAEQRDQLTFAFHEKIGELGLPMILFELYGEAGGIRYGDRLLRDLLSLPNVVGIKMATLSDAVRFQDVARLVSSTPERLLITGEDRFLGASIAWGATCALIGLGAARVDLSVGLLRTYLADNMTAFMRYSHQVDRFAQATFAAPMEGYIRRMLWALVVDDIIPEEASYDPWGPPVSDDELRFVREVLETIGPESAVAHAAG